MEFTGKVIAILEKKSGVAKASGKEWAKQEYVVEDSGQYPKKMCFEIFGEEKITEANIKMGEEIKVLFDIDANEWQGRWYNSLKAWKIQHAQPAPQVEQKPSPDTSDLPF